MKKISMRKLFILFFMVVMCNRMIISNDDGKDINWDEIDAELSNDISLVGKNEFDHGIARLSNVDASSERLSIIDHAVISSDIADEKRQLDGSSGVINGSVKNSATVMDFIDEDNAPKNALSDDDEDSTSVGIVSDSNSLRSGDISNDDESDDSSGELSGSAHSFAGEAKGIVKSASNKALDAAKDAAKQTAKDLGKKAGKAAQSFAKDTAKKGWGQFKNWFNTKK